MKRKVLVTMLCLAISVSAIACGTENTAEQQEVIATEQTAETETIEEPTEQETEMFGLDGITASEDKTASSETSSSGMNSSQPYYPSSTPCGNSQKQQAWDDFCNNWNESDYGTTTKGKVMNDFPYYGDTGYDSSLLEYRTTDKGYTVMYDTATGRVYYTGMTLPTGDAWDDTTSGGVISQYIIDNNLTGMYDLTYAQFQELLGVYNGD